MLNILKYDNQILDSQIALPPFIFHLNNVVIPMYQEKMELCKTLKSISFNTYEPSQLFRIVETMFNALYQFKVRVVESSFSRCKHVKSYTMILSRSH